MLAIPNKFLDIENSNAYNRLQLFLSNINFVEESDPYEITESVDLSAEDSSSK